MGSTCGAIPQLRALQRVPKGSDEVLGNDGDQLASTEKGSSSIHPLASAISISPRFTLASSIRSRFILDPSILSIFHQVPDILYVMGSFELFRHLPADIPVKIASGIVPQFKWRRGTRALSSVSYTHPIPEVWETTAHHKWWASAGPSWHVLDIPQIFLAVPEEICVQDSTFAIHFHIVGRSHVVGSINTMSGAMMANIVLSYARSLHTEVHL